MGRTTTYPYMSARSPWTGEQVIWKETDYPSADAALEAHGVAKGFIKPKFEAKPKKQHKKGKKRG